MARHYVEFKCIGILGLVPIIAEVPSRDIEEVKKIDAFFDTCLGFRFFDCPDHEGCLGTYFNFSGWHFKGQKLSLEELAQKYGDMDENCELIEQLKSKNVSAVAEVAPFKIIPLSEKDTVI